MGLLNILEDAILGVKTSCIYTDAADLKDTIGIILRKGKYNPLKKEKDGSWVWNEQEGHYDFCPRS